mmetsp:Transcript_98541/g.250119  ORF Transcript_98541/g.250119 Transcript_98541/m.250119 type:complete len:317 (+) Transcript_98541:185-1135(+)
MEPVQLDLHHHVLGFYPVELLPGALRHCRAAAVASPRTQAARHQGLCPRFRQQPRRGARGAGRVEAETHGGKIWRGEQQEHRHDQSAQATKPRATATATAQAPHLSLQVSVGLLQLLDHAVGNTSVLLHILQVVHQSDCTFPWQAVQDLELPLELQLACEVVRGRLRAAAIATGHGRALKPLQRRLRVREVHVALPVLPRRGLRRAGAAALRRADLKVCHSFGGEQRCHAGGHVRSSAPSRQSRELGRRGDQNACGKGEGLLFQLLAQGRLPVFGPAIGLAAGPDKAMLVVLALGHEVPALQLAFQLVVWRYQPFH